MGRRAQPQRGIIYTFRFRNEKGTHYTKLLYEGRNNKGRLEFYNYESKAYTTMPDKRFSYIHRFNLVKEEILPENKRKIPEVNPKLIIDEPKMKNEDSAMVKNKVLTELRSLTEFERKRARIAIAKDVDDLIKDIELFFEAPESEVESSFVSKTMTDLLKVGTVLDKKFFSL